MKHENEIGGIINLIYWYFYKVIGEFNLYKVSRNNQNLSKYNVVPLEYDFSVTFAAFKQVSQQHRYC